LASALYHGSGQQSVTRESDSDDDRQHAPKHLGVHGHADEHEAVVPAHPVHREMEYDAHRHERAAEPKGRRISPVLQKGGLHDDARSRVIFRSVARAAPSVRFRGGACIYYGPMMTKAQPISQFDRSPIVDTDTKNWLSRARARSVIVSRYRPAHERDRDSTSAVFSGRRRDREFHARGGALEDF